MTTLNPVYVKCDRILITFAVHLGRCLFISYSQKLKIPRVDLYKLRVLSLFTRTKQFFQLPTFILDCKVYNPTTK